MQLISVGDALLNLDRITVLDLDRTPTGAVDLAIRTTPTLFL